MNFKDKVVLVTGARIGAATAVAFAAAGAKVAMVSRNKTKLNKVAAECEQRGTKPLVLIGDVSLNEDCKRIVEETLTRFGKLDVLINNAGIFAAAGILTSNAMENYETVMTTNLNSVVYLTHLAAPHLIQTIGNIVNVSSVAGLGVMAANSFEYLTSKAALDHFSRAIALELAPKGVRVNTVNPGAVKTDIFDVPSEQKDVVFVRSYCETSTFRKIWGSGRDCRSDYVLGGRKSERNIFT